MEETLKNPEIRALVNKHWEALHYHLSQITYIISHEVIRKTLNYHGDE